MKKLLLFLVLSSFLQANEEMRPRICLNMIVKNETEVIKRCLKSVKPFIDYWVIVDTGSTDGTQEMIRGFLKDIPGELHERPWVDFGQNRQEALDLAKSKADYVLIIDADDLLEYPSNFKMPLLDKDAYFVKIQRGETSYFRIQLIKSPINWRWVGATHEYLTCDDPKKINSLLLDNVTMINGDGGHRSYDPKRFYKDVVILEEMLKNDPTNTRTVFYLGQSYLDAKMLTQALENYEKRVTMGGWDEEIFCSMYQIAMLKETLNYPEEKVVKSYCDAYKFRPSRAEPIYRLADYYRKKNNYFLSYLLANFGLSMKEPHDLLTIESWIYDYGFLLIHATSCYALERHNESLSSCVQLLAKKKLPKKIRQSIETNLKFIQPKLTTEAMIVQPLRVE